MTTTPRRWLAIALLAGLGSFAAIHTAAAQSLTATGSTLSNKTATIADYQFNSNAGRSITAGTVTLSLTKCQKNGTCVIKISATTVPAVGALHWAVTSIGSGDNNISCTAAPGAVITMTQTAVVNCTIGNGANNQDWNDIVVTFSYPISWGGTPRGATGTYQTSGIRFHLEATG